MNRYEYHLDFGSHTLVVPEGHLTDDEAVDKMEILSMINDNKPTIKIIKSGSKESMLDKTYSKEGEL